MSSSMNEVYLTPTGLGTSWLGSNHNCIKSLPPPKLLVHQLGWRTSSPRPLILNKYFTFNLRWASGMCFSSQKDSSIQISSSLSSYISIYLSIYISLCSVKFSRQNVIHVSPIIMWDELVASGWEQQDWINPKLCGCMCSIRKTFSLYF